MPYGYLVGQQDWKGNIEDYEIKVSDTALTKLRQMWGSNPCDLPFKCRLMGTKIGSDINWNNFQGNLAAGLMPENAQTIDDVKYTLFSLRILPFTSNCGAKQISYLQFAAHLTDGEKRKYMKFIEWVLYDRCNAGLILGSDFVIGQTIRNIADWGEGYKFSEEVANPTYGHTNNPHKIKMFWKTQTSVPTPEVYVSRKLRV